MAIKLGDFSIDARIVGGRWTHHRVRDHFGSESDLSVSLEGPIGPWVQGTPIHYVIEDLWLRVLELESSNHAVGHFTIDVVLNPHFFINASIHGSVARSFVLSAWIVKGGRITLNANIRALKHISVDAILV